ncbi:glycosyl hydrolases family 39 [Terrimicrobium sacchariphilum]|uniref:Glycosyl hydrolases family 39 n=2 Tax=Terrimicrobium sacchariphilum TaxID=690879 RepID=A0A146G325_TERSA|nr:glycosyl hydrolases family 39 [Terrimicrobium sacchariphilum]
MKKMARSLCLGALLTMMNLSFIAHSEVAPQGAGKTVQVTILKDREYNGKYDSLSHFKKLAGAVGWEFDPNAETTAELKRFGVKTIRCINVDGVTGIFEPDGTFRITGGTERLDQNLNTCKELGAVPHIIFGQSVPGELQATAKDVEERVSVLGQQEGQVVYFNGDWQKLRAYWRALYKYILLDQGFLNARFEIGNEPDIGGVFARRLTPEKTPAGSAALYGLYYETYTNVVKAAEQFEKEYPGLRVVIGGPALAWAFTQKYGDFKWLDRFLKDAAKDKLRVDFIGVHYYGNVSSLNGEYPMNFPSFVKMLKAAKSVRDATFPGIPFQITEWGASYHTQNDPCGYVNATNIASAWSAAFLKLMAEQEIDEAIFLVTTDLQLANTSGLAANGWGWPSLFVNPQVFGQPWPKTPAHILDMAARLSGERVTLTSANKAIDGVASLDRNKLTIMLWNYAAEIPETSPPENLGKDLRVELDFDQLISRPGGRMAADKVSTQMVSENLSNSWTIYQKTANVDKGSRLQTVEEKSLSGSGNKYSLLLPKCSVAFLTIDLKPLETK